MKCCCGWGCHYFWSCTSPALFIGWWRLWMSLASSVGAAQEKAVTQRAQLQNCSHAGNGKRWGQPEHSQRLFMCCKLCSGRGQHYLDWKIPLCWSHAQASFFLFSIPQPAGFQKEGRFHRTQGKYLGGLRQTHHSWSLAASPYGKRGFCHLHFLQQSLRSWLALGRQDLGVPIFPAPTSLGVTLASSWASDSAQGLTGAEIPPSLPPSLPTLQGVLLSPPCHTGVRNRAMAAREATAPDQHLLTTISHFPTTSWQHTGRQSLPSQLARLMVPGIPWSTKQECVRATRNSRGHRRISTPNWFWGYFITATSPLPEGREWREH